MKPQPTLIAALAIFVAGFCLTANAHTIVLGPDNPGAEDGFRSWYYGTLGTGLVSIDSEDPAKGNNSFSLAITNSLPGETNHADLRSQYFSLQDAGKKRWPLTFSFSYKLPDEVKAGENLMLFLRYFDESGENFIDQVPINLGSETADSAMTHYKTITISNLMTPPKAMTADIWVTANIFAPWTSGSAQFDDFSVTVTPPSAVSGTIIIIGVVILVGVAAFLLGWFSRRTRA